MLRKVFALASITALTGLVAAVAASGCTTTSEAPGATDDGGVSSGKDASDAKKPVVEAGPEPDAGAATCPTTTPITTADIETSFQWKAPGPAQSACSQANLDALTALFDKGGGSAKYADIKTTLGTTCAACAFTKSNATRWGLFIEDSSGQIVFDNAHGACEALVDSDACGKADAEFSACLDTACVDCADDAVDACYPKAVKGACKAVTTAAVDACAADASACDSTVDILAVVCGAGLADGGADGGGDGGGDGGDAGDAGDGGDGG